MGNTISSALTNSWMASHQRRVEKWLDNATEKSVLDALTASLPPGGKVYGWLPTARDARSYSKQTFDAYGFIDPVDKKQYWTETDLGHFLSNRFPGSELNASIPILWRCFQFHAYFPFPQRSEKLDYSAWQRAIGLLAAEGTTRLGDNAEGVTMDKDRYPDANARASKRLWIMFRSLSTHCFSLGGFEKIKPSVVGLSNTEEDLMEVLALTQPENPCIMPAPIEELRPHAKRLLSSSTPCTYPSIPRGDFLSLLRLMLSIQLDKPEWGPHEPSFYTGRVLIKPDAEILQGAADAILRCSTSSEKRDVDWESFKNVMNIYLPDFPPQFRLIFTSFLSPLDAVAQTSDASSLNTTIPVPYAQYLNLFLHPPLDRPRRYVFEDFARQEAHYTLQTTQAAYSASPPTLNTTDLVAALSPIKTGTLLLITGESIATDTHPPARVAIGACMPTPWDIERKQSFRASPPQKLHRFTPDHVLFQLEPCLQILRLAANAWIMDLIQIIDSESESKTKGGLRFGTAGGSGLSVDFDSGIATLRNDTTDKDNTNQNKQSENPPPPYSAYHSISPSLDGAHPPYNFSTSMRAQKLSIYNLGGHATTPFEELLAEKPRLRTVSPKPIRMQVIEKGAVPVPKVGEPRVGEEELRKRIQGFGSPGR